ncbi:MAG: protein kinase [Gemmatimonadota bacterium]
MDRQPEGASAVATLFGELVELGEAERAARLCALDASSPAVARELRALLDADDANDDFFGLHTRTLDGADAPISLSGEIVANAGDVIGPYRLLREIGRGGMGTVWLAHDGRLDRNVALKFLRLPDDGEGSGAADRRRAVRSRFLVEARAAASIDHPNVAGIYDVGGAQSDRLFIAMAYCENGSLAHRLAGGALTVGEALRIAAEIAAGLAAAHRRGVVHRDVKPANVLFDAAGTARLADFGIALLPGHSVTANGMVMGTLAYLAPEQLRGDRADHRADLWALGVTLYEMLTGRLPFEGTSHAAMMYSVLHATPVPPASLVTDLQMTVSTLLTHLLAKDPEQRPDSADLVEQALRMIALHGDRADTDIGAKALISDTEAAPQHLTPLIGRTSELGLVRRLLADTRLLTLTGAGGSGKTRIASETAERGTTADGGTAERVAWVDLIPLADESLVPAQIAAALRVPEIPGRTRLDAVADTIGAQRILLVLDNCEHVVSAAARAAETLLQRCPNLQILATSREALGIHGETTWLVPALPVLDARELFVQRAQSVLPGFTLDAQTTQVVDDICLRLDGIPLAIELAAARVRILSPAQILSRLDNVFSLLTGGVRTALPRHRTLRGTMEWSHELLVPRDRVLLRRLAVFSGGFSMSAAEAVCADPADSGATSDGSERLDADDILDGVSSLVDKSLVLLDADGAALRYRLLETVRQYALERLDAVGERARHEQLHAEYFMHLIEGEAPMLLGGEQMPGVMERLILDHANLRSAIAWSVRGDPHDSGRAEIALRIAGAMFWYWYAAAGWLGTAQYGEARAFVALALERGAHCAPVLRGAALAVSGFVALSTGEWAQATRDTAAAYTLLQAHGETASAAFTQAALAAAHLMQGNLDVAWDTILSAVAAAAPLPTSVLHTFCGSWHGLIARARGDVALSRAVQQRTIEHAEALAHQTSLAHTHAFLAALELDAGMIEEAAGHFRISVPIHLRLRDGWGLALDLEGLSNVAAGRGDFADAARLLGAVDALRAKIGLGIPTFEVADRERRVRETRARLGAAYDTAYAEGQKLTPGAAARLVLHAQGAELISSIAIKAVPRPG